VRYNSHVDVGRVTQMDKASITVSDEEHPTHVSTTMIEQTTIHWRVEMALDKLQALDVQ